MTRIMIGEITVLLYVPEDLHAVESGAEQISNDVAEFVSDLFRQKIEGYRVEAQVVAWEHSCLVVTLALSVTVVGTVAGGAGLYKFVKDYPKLREGAITLANDLDHFYREYRKKKLMLSSTLWERRWSLSTTRIRLRKQSEIEKTIRDHIGSGPPPDLDKGEVD